ncbi:MAG: hypothetical protein QOE57_1886, partial [Acidimicrobiaceae bacterium]|nr:hypothetical protein [Acidimicrobiaceae bacterium]
MWTTQRCGAVVVVSAGRTPGTLAGGVA